MTWIEQTITQAFDSLILGQAPRHLLQHHITRGMAKGVVDALEVIHTSTTTASAATATATTTPLRILYAEDHPCLAIPMCSHFLNHHRAQGRNISVKRLI